MFLYLAMFYSIYKLILPLFYYLLLDKIKKRVITDYFLNVYRKIVNFLLPIPFLKKNIAQMLTYAQIYYKIVENQKRMETENV